MRKGTASEPMFSGKYILSHVKRNLAWYERQGLKCINRLKCDRFMENLKENLKKQKQF